MELNNPAGQQCSNCCYFQSGKHAAQGPGIVDAGDTSGLCRRAPPTFRNAEVYATWPNCRTTDWCGAWSQTP